ncbi:MAG: hypothetical protein ACRDTZ_05345 [Pseudonocardiaceae bacterium]
MPVRPPDPPAVLWLWFESSADAVFPRNISPPPTGWYRVDGGTVAEMDASLAVRQAYSPAARFVMTERVVTIVDGKTMQQCPRPGGLSGR